MTFEENPFRVLRVSIYDTKATINERADELSFEDPDREKLIEQARTILLNPKKRIAAEIRYFDTVDFKDLFPLAGLNRLLYSLDEINDEDNLEAVVEMDALYSESTPEKIRDRINAARAVAKFPAVQNIDEIKAELKNIRYEVRERIQTRLKKITQSQRTKLANDLADMLLKDKESFGIIVEDFFDSYRLEMNSFFEATRNQIISLLIKIKLNANKKFLYELSTKVGAFASVERPLDKFSMALGTSKFDDTEEIFYTVRKAAVDLHNEKNLIDEPLQVMQMLEQNFSYLPTLVELVRKDIKFLEEEKARRPTQSFLDAKTALDKIQAEMDKHIHCKKGFEQTNLTFYEEVFKPNFEVLIVGLMLPDRYSRKPNEWKALNSKAAAIYLHMGTAMTWTNRADFALDCFQKALPYAEASDDAELITLAVKRIDEWRKINEQIIANSNDDSVGCFWCIVIAIVILWLMR
ncbi:MAG: hypothetical protein IJG33_11645 [Selenomonadaceae bacterium]|nr:hypothetical protein [Selenomonadaceae bacterium]